jgi:hypothetical protein
VDYGDRDPTGTRAITLRMVVPVLAPDTCDAETFERLREYEQVSTLEDILLIEPNAPVVILWFRERRGPLLAGGRVGWRGSRAIRSHQLEAGEQSSFVLSRETTQQDADHHEIERHLAGFDQTPVILSKPSTGGELSQCPLNEPPSRDHLKATQLSRTDAQEAVLSHKRMSHSVVS